MTEVRVAIEPRIDEFVLPDGKKIRYCSDGLYLFGWMARSRLSEVPHVEEKIFRLYEEVESKIRYLKCKEGDIFLDVGACIGSWSIYAALYGAKTYAFEPGDAQKNVLQINAELNGVRDKIIIQNMALRGPDPVQMIFDGGMKTYKKPDGLMDPEHVVIDVPSISLDEWVNQHRDELPHIDFIKIDVEGIEFEVLRGAIHTLREFEPKVIVEIHEKERDALRYDIEKLLGDLNYQHEHVPCLNDYFYPNSSS